MTEPQNAQIHAQLGRKYDAGFITDIETDSLPPGLSEDIIRALSAKKHEPEWMTEWRLAAYRHFLTMPMPDWAKLQIGPIDLQALPAAPSKRCAASHACTGAGCAWHQAAKSALRTACSGSAASTEEVKPAGRVMRRSRRRRPRPANRPARSGW